MTDIKTKSEQHSVVTETVCTKIYFNDDIQEIKFLGCVQKIYISTFYGNFELYDGSNRLLGTSTKGKIAFTKKDLQTEAAQVWYDAVSITSKPYKELNEIYLVNDPGLAFNNTSKIYIKFLDSIKQPMKYFTIPVFYTVTNVWNDKDKCLLYND